MSFTPILSLAPAEVHLWHAALTVTLEKEAIYRRLLNAEEIARADRFRFPHHRQYFIAGRAILRLILSSYLQIPAEKLIFSYQDYGKPYLAQNDLQFNVSHSHAYAVYAITPVHRIGVDLEKVEDHYADGVANRCFSAWEYQQLACLSAPERVQGFYRIWSRKEALIKALGLGLSFPINSFSVPIDEPCISPALLFNGTCDWHLQSFHSINGFVSAFATQQSVQRLKHFLWTEDGPLERN
jgi:4'-phosphopantetheinyl transferase